MAEIENDTVQTMNTKKRDAEEMTKLFLKLSKLERAKILGYAQGIESMTEKAMDKRSA